MATTATYDYRFFSVLPEQNLARKELVKNWGWIFSLGLLSVLAGILAISLPVAATYTLERVIGWILFFTGVVETLQAFVARKRGGFVWNLFGGILTAIGGLALLFYPIAGMAALSIFLIAMLMVRGVDRIVTAFAVKPTKGWGWLLTGGIVSVLLSIGLWIGYPATAFWVVGLIVGVDILVAGWSMIFFSLFLRRARASTQLETV